MLKCVFCNDNFYSDDAQISIIHDSNENSCQPVYHKLHAICDELHSFLVHDVPILHFIQEEFIGAFVKRGTYDCNIRYRLHPALCGFNDYLGV